MPSHVLFPLKSTRNCKSFLTAALRIIPVPLKDFRFFDSNQGLNHEPIHTEAPHLLKVTFHLRRLFLHQLHLPHAQLTDLDLKDTVTSPNFHNVVLSKCISLVNCSFTFTS